MIWFPEIQRRRIVSSSLSSGLTISVSFFRTQFHLILVAILLPSLTTSFDVCVCLHAFTEELAYIHVEGYPKKDMAFESSPPSSWISLYLYISNRVATFAIGYWWCELHSPGDGGELWKGCCYWLVRPIGNRHLPLFLLERILVISGLQRSFPFIFLLSFNCCLANL